MVTKKQYLTITQAAKYANVTRQTIYDWIEAGKLIPVEIIDKRYIQVETLEKLRKNGNH